jgi:hypothetical protein
VVNIQCVEKTGVDIYNWDQLGMSMYVIWFLPTGCHWDAHLHFQRCTRMSMGHHLRPRWQKILTIQSDRGHWWSLAEKMIGRSISIVWPWHSMTPLARLFLVGGWQNPSEKYEVNMTSSVGVTIPDIWKNKNCSNHQPGVILLQKNRNKTNHKQAYVTRSKNYAIDCKLNTCN